MNDTLDELQRKAEAALEPDWFDPDLIDSDAPIRSTRTARAYIACASPDVMLRLIAVARAARAVGYSNGFDAAYPDKLERLRQSLSALESAGTREEGTR